MNEALTNTMNKISCNKLHVILIEIRNELNSGTETLYGGFKSRIDGSFNQAD